MDELILKVKGDFTEFTAGLDKEMDAVKKEAVDAGKNADDLNNKFKKAGDSIAASAVKSTKAYQDLGKVIKDTSKEVQGLGKTRFSDLNKELNLTNVSMKELKTGLKDVKDALAAATDPKSIELLTERAGLLKDKIDDTNEAIGELASGSRLEQFGNTFGSLAGKIASLDFEGASEKAQQLADISSKITFKEGFTGIKQLGSSLLNLGKALLSNPVFLLGGAIVGITAAVYSWVTAESAIEKEIRLSKHALEERAAASESAYNIQITLAKALGASEGELAQLERKRTQEMKAEAIERLRIRLLEFDQQIKGIKLLGEAGKQQLKQNSEFLNAQKEISDIRRTIDELENKSRVQKIENIKAAAAASIQSDKDELKSNAELVEKQKALFEKQLEDAKRAAEERKKLLAQYYKDVFAFEQRQFGEQFKAELEAKEKSEELEKQQSQKLKDELAKRQADLQAHAKKLFTDEQKSYEERQELLKIAFENRLITEEEYNKGVEDLNKHRDQIYQEATKVIANSFADLFSALMENEEMGSEFAQAVAGFRIAMDLAQSLAATIKGAAEAASFGGPLAPFILGGYIASGIAQISTAFLRIKKLSETEPPQKPGEPKRLAAGSEYLFGGREGQDSIPALLMPGERVVTKRQNRKHFNDLSAIHHDRYDDYLRMNYIEPAVSQAVREAKENERERFAHTIASHLKDGKSWRGSNIVDTLNYMNESENKRNKQLIKVIGKSKRPSLRKL